MGGLFCILWVALNPVTSVLIRKETEIQEKPCKQKPCKQRVDVAAGPGTPGAPSSSRRQGGSPLESGGWGGCDPAP